MRVLPIIEIIRDENFSTVAQFGVYEYVLAGNMIEGAIVSK
jgi:hypothetical protein